jgi:hypothetical protein
MLIKLNKNLLDLNKKEKKKEMTSNKKIKMMNLIKFSEEFKKNLIDLKTNYMPKNKKLSQMNLTFFHSINLGYLKLYKIYLPPKSKIKETLSLTELPLCHFVNLCPSPKNSVKKILKFSSKYLPLTVTI